LRAAAGRSRCAVPQVAANGRDLRVERRARIRIPPRSGTRVAGAPISRSAGTGIPCAPGRTGVRRSGGGVEAREGRARSPVVWTTGGKS